MIRIVLLLAGMLFLAGCAKNGNTVPYVDLERFMGDWYVIGILPNPIEKKAVNGIETYSLNEDGTIAITYKFRQGGPHGKEKVLHPKAKVYNNQTRAEWRVQMFRPFWSPFLVVDLAEDYRYTVVGVPNMKFVWIMSRTSSITDTDYKGILDRLKTAGYRTDKIVKMPQIW